MIYLFLQTKNAAQGQRFFIAAIPFAKKQAAELIALKSFNATGYRNGTCVTTCTDADCALSGEDHGNAKNSQVLAVVNLPNFCSRKAGKKLC